MQQHVRRDIDLSPDMEERVNEAVSQGEYQSASEIVDEALRMWSEKRENFGYTLNELRTLVHAGLESGPGRFGSIDDIKAEARRRLAATPTNS
ncbi:type II toxin-antitoxin system ParD family antitoxin [Rhizobium sp. TH2]|uniref:type II toxin-antitoxin system ParD family antitoxin n=1 Tax=Rhizobium sp. TH2 TaxID=2775403 RepID=UPI0021580E67|nr:type II toxin-antitoxin system ParD family antitoxin [Rhizobium sp. TH2]UVC09535.1 type II toxin-antitoxin system ParD family antitoxin [Rhizobium sp. TH2]